MSAIVGIYYLDGRPVDRADLEKMTEVLAHRGPDGEGIWNKGPVGLGHRMLWTTPESLIEKLPLLNRTGDLVITADARIDNRAELIALLGLTDRRPEDITDSELILTAYEKWDEHCPEKLLGDFAFAIWNQYHHKLFCARDPMGVRPFYYYQSDRIFAFASEIKALFSLKEVPRKLNEVKVADFLVPIFDDKIITYYKDILRLPPAHSMTNTHIKKQLRTYWDLDPSFEIRLRSDQEYVEAFRDIFFEAVRCRLRSAFPVGSTLSGGLDSSSIACTASNLLAKQGKGPFHTFSVIFPSVINEDPSIDEMNFMDAVVSTNGFEPHYVRGDQSDPITAVLLHKDELIPAPNMYMDVELFKCAKYQDVRILHSGWDGDTTVTYGYDYLEELASSGNWKQFTLIVDKLSRNSDSSPLLYLRRHGFKSLTKSLRQKKWSSFTKSVNEISKNFKISHWDIIFNSGLKPLIPHQLRPLLRILKKRDTFNYPKWTVNRAYKSEFASRIGIRNRMRSFKDNKDKSELNFREIHRLHLTSGLTQGALEYLDQIAAIFSIEQRYPFCDRRVMEFCVALPLDQRLHQGWPRSILRRSMDNIIPKKIQQRTNKGNNIANFRRSLIKNRSFLDDVVFNNCRNIEKYIDLNALQSTYNRFIKNPMTSEKEDSLTIFLSATLSLWMSQSGLI